MSGRTILIILTFLLPGQLVADETRPLRPVNTYSIVARDAATGQLGVAVQSHWFSVGSGVLWAEPGIGARGPGRRGCACQCASGRHG